MEIRERDSHMYMSRIKFKLKHSHLMYEQNGNQRER